MCVHACKEKHNNSIVQHSLQITTSNVNGTNDQPLRSCIQPGQEQQLLHSMDQNAEYYTKTRLHITSCRKLPAAVVSNSSTFVKCFSTFLKTALKWSRLGESFLRLNQASTDLQERTSQVIKKIAQVHVTAAGRVLLCGDCNASSPGEAHHVPPGQHCRFGPRLVWISGAQPLASLGYLQG